MFATALSQAKDNIAENAKTTLLAIITTSFSLVILGTFILVYLNLIHLTTITFKKSNYSIFLDEDIDEESHRAILGFVQRHVDGIDNLTEISSEEARKQLIESFDEARDLLESVDFPKFPRIIEFSLSRTSPMTDKEIAAITSLEGVQEVITGRDTRHQIDIFFNISNFVGLFLIALLIVCIVLIIHNSIQLSIRARIEEIEILKVLGATNRFIQVPYIIEGVVIALASYALSLGIIYVIYQFIVAGITFNEFTYFIRAIVRYFSGFEMVGALFVIVASGIISAYFAARKIIEGLDTSQVAAK